MDERPVTQPMTFRFKKYVLSVDSLALIFRNTKMSGDRATIAELIARSPEQYVQKIVTPERSLPEFRYFYAGDDPVYGGGVMPETIVPADSLLIIEKGRSFDRNCVIYSSDGTALREFDYESRTLAILRRVLPGGRFNPRYWKHKLRSVLHNRRLPALRHLPGKVAVLNTPSSHNYYHWMAEILPRLLTLQKSGIVPDWYLVDAFAPFQLQTLELFGVPLDRVIQPYSGLHVQADKLMVPSYNFPNNCHDVAKRLIEQIGSKRSGAESIRIFVNRRGSRKSSNYDELRQILRRYKFEEHYLEDYSLAKQIELFARAETVVALHGAGLANLMFCAPGTVVIELMPEGKYQPCYPILSRLCGLRHHMLTAQKTGLHQDMEAPVEAIDSILSEVLA